LPSSEDPSTFLSAGDLRHDLSRVEVDDVDSTVMTRTRPAAAWADPCAMPACSVVDVQGPRLQAPTGAAHGTGLPVAGRSEQLSELSTTAYAGVAGTAAFVGVRTTDLPGTPPRGAPV
jgi:hypothetical protein